MKILCILGKSASGKDYILSLLEKNRIGKKVISYTTRPKRAGEINHKDYHFISEKKFLEMRNNNEFLGETSYNVNGKIWRYGNTKNSFSDKVVNLFICNPKGLKNLLKSPYKDNITALLVITEDAIRKSRYFKRDNGKTNPDILVKQWEARVKQDEKDFNNIDELLEKCPVSRKLYNSGYTDEVVLLSVKALLKK